MSQKDRQQQARILRIFRKVHRLTGATLFIVFFFISITGILLGWKKHSGGYLLEKTHKGSSSDMKEWLTLDSLEFLATEALNMEVKSDRPLEIDRIEVRKKDGVLKVTFDNYYGVQIDGKSGNILTVERRRADFIENVHDASVLDNMFGTKGIIKLAFTTIAGLALLLFTVTGFWLWYGPIKMRRQARKSS